MTRGKLLIAVSVAAWALGTAPAWAQRERGDAPSTGSAVDRGSSGSSSPSPSSGGGGSAGSTSSGGGSSSSSSTGADASGGGYTPSAVATPSSSSGRVYASAPVRPNHGDRETAQGRTSSGGGGRSRSGETGERDGSRAVPRGSDASGSPNGSSRTANASNGDADSPSRRAVPTYSRPRDGRPVTGSAVDRPAGYYGGGGNGNLIYYPSYPYYRNYNPYYYYPGYAFGLGFYDLGWYDPYYYGGYYPGAVGGGGYYGGGYGTGTSSYGQGPTGSLRLKIKPREAKVYVDGYFVGVIDEFDGMFQKLGVDAGSHRVEIKADGHQPISFDVLITPGETVTYKGELPVK
jgi:hypothetical protein